MTNRYTHLTNRIRGVKTIDEKRTLYRRIRIIKWAILLGKEVNSSTNKKASLHFLHTTTTTGEHV